MGQDQSKSKDRLIELLIVVFVVVTMSMLVVQMGMNVADVLSATEGKEITLSPVATPMDEPTPRPAPTYNSDSSSMMDA